MAGRGPSPSERRRRLNTPGRGDWLELLPLKSRMLPDLPAPPPLIIGKRGQPRVLVEHDWSPRTRASWAAWSLDPATAHFTAADVAAAVELAYILEAQVRGLGSANEVRLRMDGLGLSPKGKRDLRWRVASSLPEAPLPDPAGRQSAAKRRARLSVVPREPQRPKGRRHG